MTSKLSNSLKNKTMTSKLLNFSKLIFLVLFISTITASCGSDDSDVTNEVPEEIAEFSVLINGVQYTANYVFAIETDTNIFTIVTTDANDEGINISLPSSDVGTYTVTNGIFDDFNLGYTESSGAFSLSTSGSLTITDKINVTDTTVRLKGTFAFSLVDTNNNVFYELTEGSFELEYLSL
jgi:hypothetical protein